MVATTSEALEFKANGGTATGYLARPVEGGRHPAVVVIQEWWGLNDNIRDIANRIAAEGYVALAPDLYHGNVTAEPDEAQKLMMALQQDKAVVDMNGAVSALQARDDVEAAKIGVTGFCLGGGLALLLAMKNPAVTAAAPFYGVPMGDLAEVSNIQGGVLGLYAGQDGFVTGDYVEQVRSALAGAGVSHEIHTYAEADHAFFNDTSEAYKADDAGDAWERLKQFLALQLRG
ncbi:MAG: carboxymethylenebutenolidase [Chloroflexi bacterium]|nr:MAG: carboxymethylenebutenolidase [Chloroflexota bacterium]